MAKSTYKTFLMHKNSDAYEKLIDIKDYPDMGGSPEMLETTTLSDPMQTYIPGIKSNEALSFNANYTKADYEKILALEGTEADFALWMGGTEADGVVTPTGEDGKWAFKGYISVNLTGKGVNEVTEMVVTIAPSSAVVHS